MIEWSAILLFWVALAYFGGAYYLVKWFNKKKVKKNADTNAAGGGVAPRDPGK
jgi:nitric oxide reductase large subunit